MVNGRANRDYEVKRRDKACRAVIVAALDPAGIVRDADACLLFHAADIASGHIGVLQAEPPGVGPRLDDRRKRLDRQAPKLLTGALASAGPRQPNAQARSAAQLRIRGLQIWLAVPFAGLAAEAGQLGKSDRRLSIASGEPRQLRQILARAVNYDAWK